MENRLNCLVRVFFLLKNVGKLNVYKTEANLNTKSYRSLPNSLDIVSTEIIIDRLNNMFIT